MARKSLGRGLEALIPSLGAVDGAPAVVERSVPREGPDTVPDGQVTELTIAEIEPNPFQPRQAFDDSEIAELSESIRLHGLLQPVLVRRGTGAVPYQLVAGERRLRACRLAGLQTIPAIIHNATDDRGALELALIENVQRRDINSVEAAVAYRRMATEFGYSQDEIADRVGKSRVAVANTLRLLELPAEVQVAIQSGDLTEGHGRAILMAPDDSARRAVFRKAARLGLSVRQTEELARGVAESRPGRKRKPDRVQEADYTQVEQSLQKILGTRLRFEPGQSGTGKIVIAYYSAEERERIIGLLRRCGS